MDYATIKEIAKERGLRVNDLVALDPKNDPFYVGRPAGLRDAKWFAEWFNKLGFNKRTEIHIRGLHYRLISQRAPVITPIGERYLNKKKHWNWLTEISKTARWLGLVETWRFDDRRSAKPKVFHPEQLFEPYIEIDEGAGLYDFRLPPFPDPPCYSIENYEGEQAYHLEIWVEKSDPEKYLLPFCEEYGVNLVSLTGETSIPQALWLVDRVQKYEKPCRIGYISDFDPAGKSMPVAAARKIEKFLCDRVGDVKVFPLVLTEDQCVEYELPRVPLKDKEMRAKAWEKRYGEGATELDALIELHPGELENIVAEFVFRYRDETLDERVKDARDDIQNELDQHQQAVESLYQDEINDLRNRYDELADDFKERFEGIQKGAMRLWHAVTSDLEGKRPDITDYPIPKAEHATEVENALFDSGRDYMAQIKAYKKFQGKS